MAQNITLLGASYSDCPAILLPKTGGGTARFDDASITTATASDVASGKVFLANDGTITTGTSSGGGGSSSWTLVASTSYTVSTTSTSYITVATWATGHSEIWTSEKIVYVRVRDTAGKRTGYFYGSDTFFENFTLANGSTISSTYDGTLRNIFSYNSNSKYVCRYAYGSTGYGVFSDDFFPDGSIRFRARYNSNYSLTINGTYSVEVYLLDPPTNAPIFT